MSLLVGPSWIMTAISVVYLAAIVAIIVFVYRWMKRLLRLNQEQNDLLRELIRKLENR